MKFLLVFLLITGSCFAKESYEHNISSFNKAKKTLKKIHPEYKTFYCGCDYSYKTKKIDVTKCGYVKAGNYKGFVD